jgi:hypothetical protein
MFAFTGCASLDKDDKALLAANYIAIAADTHQTRHIIDSDKFYELNPMVGENKDRLYLYSASKSVLITVIAFTIRNSKYRKMFLAFCCGQTVEGVSNNHRIGVR